MTSSSVVTVTIPSYNYVEYLRECVESAVHQEGVEVDVAIVENASTDGSRDLARQLAAEYDCVRLIEHPDNRGLISSLDRCRDEVRGEYTVLLCADDCLTPGSLKRSVEFMDAHPEVGLSYGPVLNFSQLSDVSSSELVAPLQDPVVYAGPEWIRRCTKVGMTPIHTPEATMRASVLEKAGRLDPACPKTSDFNMWLRMAAYRDIAYLPGPPLALFRRHDRNDSSRYSQLEDLQQRWVAFRRFLDSTPPRTESRSWEHTVRHALAAEARDLVDRMWMESDRSDFDGDAADSLLEFANELDPSLPRWHHLRTEIGRHASARMARTLLIPRRAVARHRRDAMWRRFRRFGV